MATTTAAATALSKSSRSSSSLSKNLLLRAAGVGHKRSRQQQQASTSRPAMVPSLSRLLVAPSRVATALEWKSSSVASSSVLTVNVARDALELLVASHPIYDEPVQTLPSIPLKTEIVTRTRGGGARKQQHHQQQEGSDQEGGVDPQHVKSSSCRRLVPSVAMEFKQILHDWQVSGVVVNWPVQPEGWCGYSCGKVLFVLDHLNSYQCFNNSPTPLPMCLWDQVHHDAPYEDEWGRSEFYSMISSETVHKASVEQYDLSSLGTFTVAAVWEDYCRAHWPELFTYAGVSRSSTPSLLLRSSTSHPSKPWLSASARNLPLHPSKNHWRGGNS